MKLSDDNVVTVEHHFGDDGATPNHPAFALLVHHGAIDVAAPGDPATLIEATFAANGWTGLWRNGIHPYHHYHSTCHEALGIARGWVEVRFGGERGMTVKLQAGDVAVLPAGTGHKREDASPDLLVVGAYPPGQPYDMIRSGDLVDDEHRAVTGRISLVAVPATDPVFGETGGAATRWRDAD